MLSHAFTLMGCMTRRQNLRRACSCSRHTMSTSIHVVKRRDSAWIQNDAGSLKNAHFRGDADTRILGQSKAESIRKGLKAKTLQSCEGGRRLASDACHRCVLVQHLDKQKPSCKCTFAVKACMQRKALTN